MYFLSNQTRRIIFTKKARENTMEFDYEEIVKATYNLSQSRLIGKGSHGSVYKGTFEDDQHGAVFVAAKKSSSNDVKVLDHENSKKLENEINLLSSLRHHRNPHIIHFLGTASSLSDDGGGGGSKVLVMEFMPNGSLYDLLYVSTTPPPWPRRFEIAIQIAKAIRFLHEGNGYSVVIHRDIKCTNILFDSDWNAKLADFGLAVSRVDSASQTSIQPAGTIGYIDPSYTNPGKLSTKNDIFSYGVVLLELISCRRAIDLSKTPSSIVEWALPLIRDGRAMEICDQRVALPSHMQGIITHILDVAARCVSLEEEKRPEIGEIFMVENFALVERVRIVPSWMSLLRKVIMIKRKRMKMKIKKKMCDNNSNNNNNSNSNNNVIGSDLSRGKMILREILADITLS